MPSLQDSEETSHERTMMPPVDSLIPMDAEIEKAPQLASVEENPTTDVQKESQMEDIPEERQMIPIITPNRRSRRFEEKREGQQYQIGQIAVSVSKRKALLSELAPDTSRLNFDGLNLVLDDMLLSLVEIYDIDMGIDNTETSNILTQL